MGHHRLLVFGLGFDEAEEVEVGGGEFFETSRVVASNLKDHRDKRGPSTPAAQRTRRLRSR